MAKNNVATIISKDNKVQVVITRTSSPVGKKYDYYLMRMVYSAIGNMWVWDESFKQHIDIHSKRIALQCATSLVNG